MGREPLIPARFPDYERETFSLWFRTQTRPWQAWCGECSTAPKAVAYRDNCLAAFPDAETVVVKRVEKREGLSPERLANLTYRERSMWE